jgi:molybdopterin-guanine dinucleotide biosynthesis protein A
MTAPIGAVLCGGASRRMGVDKATMPVDGVAMARRVADTLRAAGCPAVFAIGGDAEALERIGLEFVADEFPGEGPLGAIVTALHLGSPVAVIACDLPHVRPETVTALADALGRHDAAIAQGARSQPLCAIWSEHAASRLQARFEAGERAMHSAIDGLDIAWVLVPDADLQNLNTPDDLELRTHKDRG